jgi:nitrite reductase/ring-hydroxylating ferredoxin subunit/alkylhydroperoxidase/carboxymuconolactone decarboxylase family protein YurZ
MSDALKYLIKARPEAMGAYFSFLKETGKHLDPKTRSLISVITKIDSQTERGLRQYLPRALRDGATANEVLDAIMMAFPTLGLAKITWAIDIMLDMDIPEFRTELLGVEPEWHELIAWDEVQDGDITYIEDCDGRSVFIYRSGDDCRVYDSRCPHQVTNIPHLALSGVRLTCPKHQWAFDVTTGECVDKGTRPLNQFENRITEGRLQARW